MTANSGNTAYLGPGLKITGEISGNEDLWLDSKIEGSVSIGGFRLTIGQKSEVEGEVVAREVVVSGKVTGNISARDRLEVKKGSTVVGDLSTARILIEDGAYLKGAVEIDRSNTRVGADLDTLLGKSK
ncbi:MAG TPA: polymer-forming cytoskeletal protein [Candidatus Acidoferrales bacterium]|nr:polymer-forming cytoskeletal protein [Candidatus Acidoferrales bacterium]